MYTAFIIFNHKEKLEKRSTMQTLFISLVLFVITLLFLYHWNFQCPHQQQETKAAENKPINLESGGNLHTSANRKTIILYWTTYFGENDFEVGLGPRPFRSCSSDLHCLTTTDRTWFNESDAVVFHGRDLHVNDLPPPEWRRRQQIFIFLLLESPVHVDLSLLRQPVFRHYFNRTMTYRRDSDIVYLYGRLKCIDSSPSSNCVDLPRLENAAPAPQKTWTTVAQVDFASKNRTAAWFVSNCDTNSQRASLVRRLSEFIPLDVYGKCAVADAVKDGPKCSSRPECDTMLGRHHRFYLSFENALCPDYVTEKLYRPLAHGTVPVVYGGANYSLYLPAGSYVNAMDFESPQKLAEHLKRLMTDDKLYSSYLAWRAEYTVEHFPSIGWCELCRLLKDPHVKDESYSNVGDWWSGETTNQTCSPPPKSLI